MQRAKTFFYVSLGILALAGAFHLGAQTAQSQAGTAASISFNHGVGGDFNVVTSDGDVYRVDGSGAFNPFFRGNIFSGAPVQATETTWGRIKADRR